MNVLFASGAYFYIVGTASPSGAHGAPTQSQLSTAATEQYLAGMGCVAGSGQKS
jgi:hypothetical protein